MSTTFPGTTIEVSRITPGASRVLFDGIFTTGGITLSQVCIMTGLEPHVVQNWVKRGFVTSPVGRVYTKEQFARVVIINTLRQVLQIERICQLIKTIAGVPNDKSDDLISDDELYHRYVDMLAEVSTMPANDAEVMALAKSAAETFEERIPGGKKQLTLILQAMLYAHAASEWTKRADQLLSTLQ